MNREQFARRFLMLGQTLERQTQRSDEMQCLVPKAVLWERSRQGPVFGIEQLFIQGMDQSLVPAAKEFSNNALTDMAGRVCHH